MATAATDITFLSFCPCLASVFILIMLVTFSTGVEGARDWWCVNQQLWCGGAFK